MLVGIYVRVSTTEQAKEGYSLGEQEDRLKAYCKARGWSVAKVYSDGGFSGGNTDRPALQNLISDIKRNKIEGVLVYKLDRLSRSQKDTLNLIEDVFIKNDINFVSMSENFDTSTPFGKAMIGILSVFAQLEREQIRERMQLGAVARAKDGYFHGGGFAPIGYDYINGELVINDYEAMQVREIYDLYLKGYPVHRILLIMQKKYNKKYGGWAHDSSIRSCLNSPIYYGMISYAGEMYEGRHEPIVTKELYDKVQARRKQLSDTDSPARKTPFKHSQLLSGSIFCGNCGARYYTHHISGRKHLKDHKGWNYYACYSRMKSNKRMVIDPNCKNKNWRVEEVDNLVIEQILKLQFDETYLKEISNRNEDTGFESNTEDIINKRIQEVTTQLDKVMDMYQLGMIDLEVIKERVAKLTEEREALEIELEKIREFQENKKTNLDDAKLVLRNANYILENGELDEQRMLIQSLIEYIELFDEHIEIHWNF